MTWTTTFTCWGRFKPERGNERVEAGRLTAPLAGSLTVPASSETRAITPAGYRLRMDSVNWQIRAILNPDERGFELEMVVERNVGL